MDHFEWDEPKRQQNLVTHGLDFARAYEFDWDEAMVVATYSSRTGRPRFRATGVLGDRLITIIFSPLGAQAYSIVSMRPASREERYEYEHQT